MRSRFLRTFVFLFGLGILAGCVSSQTSMPSSSPSSTATATPTSSNESGEGLRLARLLRDNGRLAAANEIYVRLEGKGKLTPRQTLEYASVAANVLPPRDALSIFVLARQRLGGGEKLTPDERLVICLGIGRGRLGLGQLQGAIKEFRCALDVDGDNVQALNGLGVAFNALGRTDEADALLTHAQDLDPANVAVRNNLALLWLGRGDVQSAIEILETEATPKVPTLALNLALAYLLKDKEMQARRVLQEQLSGARVGSLMKNLRQRAERIRNGNPAASELLAASRDPLALETSR